MNKIKGSMTITLTAEEVVGINELLEKDLPKPLAEHERNDGTKTMHCPRCGRYIPEFHNDWKYCPDCGQAIDIENIAL